MRNKINKIRNAIGTGLLALSLYPLYFGVASPNIQYYSSFYNFNKLNVREAGQQENLGDIVKETCPDFAERNEDWKRILVELNPHIEEDLLLPGQRVLVPEYAEESN